MHATALPPDCYLPPTLIYLIHHELESDFIVISVITLNTALDDMTKSHISVRFLHVQAHNLCEYLKKRKVQ